MSLRPTVVVRIDAAGLVAWAGAPARGPHGASGVAGRTFSKPRPFIPGISFAGADAGTTTPPPRPAPFIVRPPSIGGRPSLIG